MVRVSLANKGWCEYAGRTHDGHSTSVILRWKLGCRRTFLHLIGYECIHAFAKWHAGNFGI